MPPVCRWFIPTIILSLLGSATASHASPPTAIPPATVPSNPETAENNKRLAELLRKLLLANMPDPILENANGWGDQREVVVGMHMEREAMLRWRAVQHKAMRNEGHWQKVRVQAIDPAKTLSVEIKNMQVVERGRKLFDAIVGLDVRMTYEQQFWKSGVRMYAGETRARCRTELKLQIEITDKFEVKPGSLLPDILFRIRVTKADLTYTDMICEHTLGMDGKPAEVLGRAVHEFIKKVKPDMEKDLLAKANTAIVKAADTKEVKLELSKLLGPK